MCVPDAIVSREFRRLGVRLGLKWKCTSVPLSGRSLIRSLRAEYREAYYCLCVPGNRRDKEFSFFAAAQVAGSEEDTTLFYDEKFLSGETAETGDKREEYPWMYFDSV